MSNRETREWWIDYATAEVDGMLAKMDEYGAGDLYKIGETFQAMTFWGIAQDEIDSQTHYELGVLFYLVGKVQRLLSAAERGRPASDDTWHDIAVYAKMVLATRKGAL